MPVKTREDYSKIPWNVKQKLIDFSVVQMKGTIRQLDKEFKFLVDNSAFAYYRLRVELFKNSSEDVVKISLETENVRNEEDNFYVEFHHHQEGYRVVKGNWEEKVVEVAKNGTEFPFIDRAALHLAKILKNPKLSFQKLRIKFVPPRAPNNGTRLKRQFKSRKDALLRKLRETFVELNHQLQVEDLKIDIDGTEDDLLTVIQCLRARTLKNIVLGDRRRPVDIFRRPMKNLEIGRIIQTDQWREAKKLWADKYSISQPISTFSHFDDLNVHIASLTLAEFQSILQNYANNPSFVEAAIKCSNFDSLEILRYVSQFPFNVSDGIRIGWKLPIPNSTDGLVVVTAPFLPRISIQRSSQFRSDFIISSD